MGLLGTNDKLSLYSAIVDSLRKTYIAKNHDYGDSFGQSIAEFGLTAAIVRIGDKYNRLKALVKTHEQLVSDESLRDTLLDMANYAIMTAVELDSMIQSVNTTGETQ